MSLRRRSINYSDAPPLILTYVDNQQNASGTGATHPGMNFGPENAKRYLVAAIGIVSATTFSSVIIGGVTATSLVSVVSSFGIVRSAIYIAAVPTGTSGDVTVNMASGGGISSVALYSLINLVSPTAFATATNFGLSPLSMSLGVQAKGAIIATAYRTTPGASTATWTGLTTVDLNLSFAGELHTAGNYIATSAVTQSLSVANTGNNAFSCCAVSLR